MALERKGIPTATFVTSAFSSYSEGLCRMQRMEKLPLVVIQHPVAARPEAELRGKVRSAGERLHSALTNVK